MDIPVRMPLSHHHSLLRSCYHMFVHPLRKQDRRSPDRYNEDRMGTLVRGNCNVLEEQTTQYMK